MSNAKFASVTAQLLARKGEAMPWVEPGGHVPAWNSVPSSAFELRAPANEKPQNAVPRREARSVKPAQGGRPPSPVTDVKKLAVRMTQRDYERLGIVAVKTGTTRQHLMQEALQHFLAAEAKRFQTECACLGADFCEAGCLT